MKLLKRHGSLSEQIAELLQKQAGEIHALCDLRVRHANHWSGFVRVALIAVLVVAASD